MFITLGWSAVCDCGITCGCLCSVPWVGLQFVIVALPVAVCVQYPGCITCGCLSSVTLVGLQFVIVASPVAVCVHYPGLVCSL